MATIRRKRKGWQVLIRKKFAKQIIKTFHMKEDAEKYAREKKKRDYRQSYEEEIAMWEKDIHEYIKKGDDDAVNRSKLLLAGIKNLSKEEWEEFVVWETTYIKKPLKDKLNDMYFYEVYFIECEKIRSESPITFDTKWQ